MGLATHRVPTKGFDGAFVTSSPPFPSFAWRKDSYTIEAEIRQHLTRDGFVGLYVCDSRRTTPAGEGAFVLDDAVRRSRRGCGPVSVLRAPCARPQFDQWPACPGHPVYSPQPDEWRVPLRVTVTLEALEVCWRIRTTVRTIPRAEIDAAAARLHGKLDPDERLAPPSFKPRQSLGIYVKDSSASVRRVNFAPVR